MSMYLSVMRQKTSFFYLFSMKKASHNSIIHPRGQSSWILCEKYPILTLPDLTKCYN